jgi:hypothetical protein
MAQAFADAGEAVRMTVRLIDCLQAGKRSTGQCGQQFLRPDLGRVVVQRGQYPVDQADPVLSSPALHEARLSCPVRSPGRTGRRIIRYQCRGDQRVQPIDLDQTGADQFQVG